MVKESDQKESRGWQYKELAFDFTKKPIEKKEDNKPLKGEQISIFDKGDINESLYRIKS